MLESNTFQSNFIFHALIFFTPGVGITRKTPRPIVLLIKTKIDWNLPIFSKFIKRILVRLTALTKHMRPALYLYHSIIFTHRNIGMTNCLSGVIYTNITQGEEFETNTAMLNFHIGAVQLHLISDFPKFAQWISHFNTGIRSIILPQSILPCAFRALEFVISIR